ncbi:unnamed protein product [[Candida] boidinii]|uniref:Unnamed protein product n=1 Tax=Candida boidinii TaxID=5477 RepID=A0ACB5TSS4_CANBO|nr:unnamed protein product [[Candida] boidinii]
MSEGNKKESIINFKSGLSLVILVLSIVLLYLNNNVNKNKTTNNLELNKTTKISESKAIDSKFKTEEIKLPTPSDMSHITSIEIPAKSGKATASLIIFHGLGDSGSGWKSFADSLKRDSDFEDIEFVLPNAPLRKVSIAGGNNIPAWFDIFVMGGNPNSKQDVTGILEACSIVNYFIEKEIAKGIPAERIIIGGFSQGASITLSATALIKHKIAGTIVMSGFCGIPNEVKARSIEINKETPIFQGHGTSDPVIPYENAKKAGEFFKVTLGFKNLSFNTYPGMPHSTSPQEVEDIKNFIKKNLSKL